MAFLARKISRQKWEAAHGVSSAEIPADAITADCRTANNALSLWRYDPERGDKLDSVALAIAAAAGRIDKLDLVWIEEQELEHEGILIQATRGKSAYRCMNESHRDAVSLELQRLGKIASRLAESITQARWKRFSKADIKNLLLQAYQAGEIDQSSDQTLVQEIKEEEAKRRERDA